MANRGAGGAAGAGGGGGGAPQNEYVEFTVKAEEDLYLTGSENTIRRVTADTNYSCLMLKTQRFSDLFRHYAKYHGLRKDDLEYYFVHPLENEDTPESVQLLRGDIIMVRKKRKPDPPEPAADDTEFFKDMKELLDDEEHMDTLFLVHRTPPPSLQTKDKKGKKKNDIVKMEEDNDDVDDDNNKNADLVEIRAHKCILTARADYFKALFRKNAGENASGNKVGTFKESTECIIRVEPIFTPKIVRLLLEFLYTNRIECMMVSSKLDSNTSHKATTDELLSLLHLSDMWQLRDLKRLVEHELMRHHMKINTVARMYCATDDFHAKRLHKSCLEFITDNYREVCGTVSFQEELKHYPELMIPILKAAADLIPEQPPSKKARTSGASDLGKPDLAGSASSPVPEI